MDGISAEEALDVLSGMWAASAYWPAASAYWPAASACPVPDFYAYSIDKGYKELVALAWEGHLDVDRSKAE